jgi:hypothetical protein
MKNVNDLVDSLLLLVVILFCFESVLSVIMMTFV